MRCCWIIGLLMIALAVHGQDVWTEGTQWVTTYEDGTVETYTLKQDTIIDETAYLKLVVEEKDSLVGYVRSVVGDTVIHARGIIDGTITEDFLLYDFGTFEPGTSLHFSEYNYNSGKIISCSVIIDSDSLTYYNDVIEEGDILPCFKNIVFKVGYLGNPMALFYYNIPGLTDLPENGFDPRSGGGKPNKKNVSHVVLKPKGKGGGYVVMYPSSIRAVRCQPDDTRCYDLFGRRVIPNGKGIYVTQGKKKMIRFGN
ncbi:MAG: hypothetical protein IKX33_04315 [Prevotella sp.]|nr:hypothetical protein [Prevotella sp.]